MTERRAFQLPSGKALALAAAGFVAIAALPAVAQPDAPKDAAMAQIARGAYVARAAGCMSCHAEDLSGGYAVETPMGTIVASNISPSIRYGTGDYSRDDLADVLRKGVAPDRRLYPAMPYASYRGMRDADIDDLYVWLQAQDPVERPTEAQTDLPFPFNIRTGVLAWNWLQLDTRNLPQSDDPILARGAYLVNHLGHCGECHTPRDDLFGMRDDLYLAGATMDGWHAPNLTGDPVTGLGEWSAQDLIDYLGRGQAADRVQAAGPMADVVQHATRHLHQDDLAAMAAYLKALAPIPRGNQQMPVLLPEPARRDPVYRYGQIRAEMEAALGRADLTPPEQLYLANCAACHGVSGQGQAQAYYPPLQQNAALRRTDPMNLLQVLLHGVPAGKLHGAPAMPGFANELSAAQIAMLANYTRTTFGDHADSDVTAADVTRIAAFAPPMSPALRMLQIGAWVGVALLLILVLLAGWWLLRRRRRHLRAAERTKP
ncbi:c-type cytochrome [Yoonia vestfoldensis]|uniref:Fructose dehydrogenase cytochrome subunit n=1 Tax=Yoonia vestfoldensis TaxID=245188 RepID=A0A1Y0E9M2_9RHOB|nr:cytochrome c [Yoonia vestfoldensis]ARU00296.1 fructose dehydrogenase cytochrome subunit [Yoonia vestfoldensis]